MINDLDAYQLAAYGFANYPERLVGAGRPDEIDRLSYAIHGLTGEAGELANKIKKVFRDDDCVIRDEVREALRAELGDVLWYVGAVATELDLSLSTVAQENLDKLGGRRERGTLDGSGDHR